jgi:hypothetical protein
MKPADERQEGDMKMFWKTGAAAAVVGVVAFAAVSLANALESAPSLSPKVPEAVHGPLAATAQNVHLSSPVLIRYWAKHPDQAPASLRSALSLLSRTSGSRAAGPAVGGPEPAAPSVAFNYRFNGETLGMPQNEESLAKCGAGVLGGVNDYRGFYHSNTGDGTGWEYSADGGASLLKEGDLPGVTTWGFYLPSGGDPAAAALNPGGGCVFYAASLNYNFNFDAPSSVVAYRTGKSKLDGPCASNDTCWPTKKVVARYRHAYAQFADKEWIAAGPAEGGGSQVVVVYTLFDLNESSIRAVICDDMLTTCGSPMKLDSAEYWTNDYVQFPYVSIGPSGKIYVTWVYWQWDNTLNRPTALLRGQVYSGGSWGPTRAIRTENQPLAQGYAIMLAMTPRVATQAKGAVSPGNRWWVTWDRCGLPLTIYSECDNADIVARFSDDDGASWSSVIPINTNAGHQFFPSQPAFGNASNMVIAYYTTEYARAADGFDSRYDTAARFSTDAGAATPTLGNVRLTAKPTSPFSDWFLLSWFFIGDYLSAVAEPGVGYVHYNAEYTKLVPETAECDPPSLCAPANQQDNYLSKFKFP